MIALVSSSAATGLDPDESPLVAALEVELGGGAVSVEHWDDPAVDWSRFDSVVIRSTWDYPDRHAEFVAWAGRVESVSRLVNPAAVVRWNTEKHYLGDLAAEGAPIVPTTFVEPCGKAPRVEVLSVVKPSVGASSEGARRCRPDEVADHVAALHADGRTAMIQPYLGDIDRHGERSLCFLPGADGELQFSHALWKAPLLRDGPVRRSDLVDAERVRPHVPTTQEHELARFVLGLDCVRSRGPLGYARVDLVPAGGRPVVMELELVEPSLYLGVDPGSARRAARAFARHLA